MYFRYTNRGHPLLVYLFIIIFFFYNLASLWKLIFKIFITTCYQYEANHNVRVLKRKLYESLFLFQVHIFYLLLYLLDTSLRHYYNTCRIPVLLHRWYSYVVYTRVSHYVRLRTRAFVIWRGRRFYQ